MQGVEIPADVDPASPETLAYFEAKLQELRKSGKNIPRAVIFCNPNNPLGKLKLNTVSENTIAHHSRIAGFIYPRETILEYCRFCQRNNLHL